MGSIEMDMHALRSAKLQALGPVQRMACRVLPPYFLEEMKFELHMLRVRLGARRTRLAFRGARDLMVNLGAGNAGKQGWVNVDGFQGAGVNCVYDIRTDLPFPDGSVRGIFTEHLMEHLDYTDEAPRLVTECYRVLQTGGVVRIIVPDAERYLRLYSSGGWDGLTDLRPLEAKKDHYFGFLYNTRMELINVVFRQRYEHKFAYDFETLAFLLRRGGFREVIQQVYGKSIAPCVCIDSAERASESLYVEAIKK